MRYILFFSGETAKAHRSRPEYVSLDVRAHFNDVTANIMQFVTLRVATQIFHGGPMRADLPVLLPRVGRTLHLRDPRCALRARRFYRALFISLLLFLENLAET